MNVNPGLERLHAYPFERLRSLIENAKPPAGLAPILMSIGEPRHPAPSFIVEALKSSLHTLGTYPLAHGLPELRVAAASWLERRYQLPRDAVDPITMVLPVNGTREALFAFVQAMVDAARDRAIVMPNPFYQIYEGAALLASAEPVYLDTVEANGFQPDLDSVPVATWQRCAVLFLCSPGNPTGAVLSREYLAHALELADRHDFVVAADECYADIYLDEERPPPGLLQVARDTGRDRYQRCVVFHSLSKRSSVPGLRSGIVAGDPAILGRFLLYRTYHGCAVPLHTQLASVPAWNDDAHAQENRALYQQKFAAVLPILQPVMRVSRPDAAFYLWPDVGGDDEEFARELHAQQNVLARWFPGTRWHARPIQSRTRTCAYLARPGRGRLHGGGATHPRFPGNPPGQANMSSIDTLRSTIDTAFEQRARLTPASTSREVCAAIDECIALLDSGSVRVAEPRTGGWAVNEWLKKAVLLSFRTSENAVVDAGFTRFYDKVALKYSSHDEAAFRSGGARVVPHAIVRRGAHVASGVVLMPSYVNIGAYVDTGTMVDTWATVGSCAQVGKNVHLSGGVGIGGVLEPLQATPTIIEDDCFIGARSEIVEGVVVERGCVISMGVFIGQSTRIYDRATGQVTRGRVPAGSVVVPGSLPSPDGKYSLACAVIVKRVDEQTRARTSLNELLRET
jgi:N-succinyldiaminopimelate aminotransferase